MQRRQFLKAAGVTLGLPFFPSLARAEPPRIRRAVFVYMPNGVRLDTWFPKTTGADYELTPSLEPLKDLRKDITLLGGLDRQFVPGTGVHAQCGSCWLTSSPPTETKDGGFPTNTSLDQMLAKQIGGSTPLPSLELSCNNHADNKESKYFESISWYGPGHAAAAEKNPRAVFQRLFGKPHGSAGNRGVLDLVLNESKALRGTLATDDRRKLDEYLDAVRAVESRIEAAEHSDRPRTDATEPKAVPVERGPYIRLMMDMVALAFRHDRTRVATLVIDPERWDSPRTYDGVFDKPQNHHVLTHTKGDEAREKVAKIDRFHVEQYAHLVKALKAVPEGDHTLLDDCAVVLGSGISDGDKHLYSDLPVVLAGRAGGSLKTGFYQNYPGPVPLARLWHTLLHAFGAAPPRFADSTGPLSDLLR